MTATMPADGPALDVHKLADQPAIRGFEAAVETTATPEAVFALLQDLSAHLDWGGRAYDGHGEHLVSLDGPSGPVNVGTSWTSEGAAHEGTYHDRSTVTRIEASTRLEFVTQAGFQRGSAVTTYPLRHIYTITPTATGSRVVHREEFLGAATGGSFLSRLLMSRTLAPITERVGKGLLRSGLENLVRMAERGARA